MSYRLRVMQLLVWTIAVAVFWGIAMDAKPANAGVVIKFKRTGSWPQNIYNPLTGSLITTINVPHFELSEIEFCLPGKVKGLALQYGSEAESYLTNVLGDGSGVPTTGPFNGIEIGFDNTMHLDPPNATTFTNSGTEFNAVFAVPLVPDPITHIVNLSVLGGPLTVSTPLDVFDPSHVAAFVIDENGLSHAAVVAVPEPGTLSIVVLGGIMLLSRHRNRKKG